MKIDKFIATTGYTSRRKAYDLVSEKRVLINSRTATHSTRVEPGDIVQVDGQVLKAKPQSSVLLAYNKPRGVICTTEKVEGNIVDALGYQGTVYPVGRLDKNSEGLILLTNQGELIDRIANAANNHEKEYIVTLNLPLRKKFLEEIAQGVLLDGIRTKPCFVEPVPGTRRIFRIILTQGLNRQIRRMCGMYGYQVIRLQRVRVMNIRLGGLQPGQHRELGTDEKEELLSQL